MKRRHVEQHLTREEAAARLGVEVCFIDRAIKAGRIARVARFSRRAVRIPEGALAAFVERHTQEVVR